jgi:uncharacterized protein
MMRQHKTRKAVLLGLAALLGLYAVGSMALIKSVFDKHFPRVEQSRPGYLQYGDVDGYDRTVVHFESGKNTLTGYIYGGANQKGLVVISHGLGFGAEDYLAEMLYFVDKGWRVLAFDNTGTYASEGDSTMGLPQSAIDLDAALTYIENSPRLNDLPVVLYGHSWGAYAVAAVLSDNHEVAAVASIAGFNAPMGLLAEQMKSLFGPLALAEYPFGWLYQTVLFGSSAWKTAVDGINSTDTAVMIIHGDQDEAIAYDGASIIAQREQITNPNMFYKTCSVEHHNGHNNLFVSDAARTYIDEKNEEYRDLYEHYKGEIPDEIQAAFYEGIDRFQTSELDADFMEDINQFFEDHLGVHRYRTVYTGQTAANMGTDQICAKLCNSNEGLRALAPRNER